MKRLQKVAVLLSVIGALDKEGSWCGETHIQKAVYFLQTMFKVPLGFEFVLYKHGPYSFALTDELMRMRADRLLEWVPKRPYGASFRLNDQSNIIIEKFTKTVGRYQEKVNILAKETGDKRVRELEKLATAQYVTLEGTFGTDAHARAKRLHNLKPHIPENEALEAIEALDSMAQKVESLLADGH